ncbi:hypothetical protein EDB92DRAFT_1951988 [Lactarius akahatsu]|uniref:Uncharacterized protein n=1 Tax=Lactarius akahatsu TaxID=416441 RepID=A0AAD4L2S3_9AGAM|nr:hypothetical protein EDB92DRAFT_1957642 [Lactarius akahatsu]KAH8982968.1 hypothetical protein EDB92DRAFT_1951988 [Lactarius akahatsu]
MGQAVSSSSFSTTAHSTVQANNLVAPAFQFAVLNEMYTCGISVVQWTYSGPLAPMALNITNIDVVQQAPLAGPVTSTGQSIESVTTSAIRSVAQRDISRRQDSGYGGSYLPPIDEQLATQLDPLVGIWRWSSTNVPQGWYRMLATIQGILEASSSSFFVQNGTNVDCILQFPTSTSVVQTPATVKATTTGSSSKTISHTGAVAGGTIGGVATVILVIGTIAFVWRRRRQHRMRKTVGPSFSNALVGADADVAEAPFNPPLTGTSPLDAGSQQHPRSDPVGMPIVPLNPGPSSSGPLLQSSPCTLLIPVGLSSKELAQLRSRAVHVQLNPAESASSDSQPAPLPIVTARQSEATPPPEDRALQSEVEHLRREVQQLRAQEARAEIFEAPPSYGAARTQTRSS